MHVFITGGTGFVGRHLAYSLIARGDLVTVLTRDEARTDDLPNECSIVEGDPTEVGEWMTRLDGCDAVVHLAGAPIDGKRWNARYRQVLLTSRVDSTHNVVTAIADATAKPTTLVSASGIDIYPFADELADLRDYFEDSWVAENAPKSDSFLGRLCREWEREALVAASGCRVACMRTGMVLGPRDGALSRMLTPFKLFAGGKIGSGAQWTSWIHIDDAVRAYIHILDTAAVKGPVNLVAPNPVTNKAFAKTLGRVMSRPSLIPVPAFALKMAIGGLAEYVLGGRRVQPKCLLDSGFEFNHPDLEPALEELLAR